MNDPLLWTRFWLLFALSVLLIALVGCTTYGTPTQIENWPQLAIVEHRVTAREIGPACQRYAPAWGAAQACAIFFRTQCHVYATNEEHAAIERDNCRGLVFPYWQERAHQIRDEIHRLNGS